MPYLRFRPIAYEVPTVTHQEGHLDLPPISGWTPGPLVPAIPRLPIPALREDVQGDAQNRLRRLAAVVDAAQARVAEIGDDGDTLKVFLVPEFYFRPPATLGADYVHGSYPVPLAMDVLNALRVMFAHPDFSDWLFFCGTVMHNTGADLMAPPLIFNTAVSVRGGPDGPMQLVEKQLASDIDGVPGAMMPGYDPSVHEVLQSWPERRQHIRVEAGIPFGTEICLDHRNSDACRVLKGVRRDWPLHVATPQAVRIHVLTAGGMGIQPHSVAADPGGWILRCDGMADSVRPRSEVRRIERYTRTVGGVTEILPGFSSEAQAQAEFSGPVPGNLEWQFRQLLEPELRLAIPAGYRQHPQAMVCYPAQTL